MSNKSLFDRSLLLAPMAGVNDPVFRAICKRHGAALTYTEMVSAKGLEYRNAKTQAMLYISDAERPAAVQLFGSQPEVLAEQARQLEAGLGLGAAHPGAVALIDVNMGCPARKIAGKGEGAALMRDMALAEAILKAVVAAVRLPVTVKFRKGYELGEDIALEFARMAESCGVAALAVHGRYARQFYHGLADKDLARRVKQAVSIPVIASGDVFCGADIRFYFEECGVDAVMVARGARGNPWIFSQDWRSEPGPAGKLASPGCCDSDLPAPGHCEAPQATRQSTDTSGNTARLLSGCDNGLPSLEQRIAVAWEHCQGLAQLAPKRLASMRRHIDWYFRGSPQASAIRRAVNSCSDLEDYRLLLEQVGKGLCQSK